MPEANLLITNDDGFRSPGLWAAVHAAAPLGRVHVVAPRDQSTGTGRSMPDNSDGIIEVVEVEVGGRKQPAYSVGGTPAQVVLHAVLEILPQRPDLVISGINYGENPGSGVTISGTIGAALEAAALGIPALAVSLQTDPAHYHSHSNEVDFRTAAHFTALFAGRLLAARLPADVDVLKLEIPAEATAQTAWVMTRLSRSRYYEPLPPRRRRWDEPAKPGYQQLPSYQDFEAGTDIYALRVEEKVAVTPLSLDMTSRVDLAELARLLSA